MSEEIKEILEDVKRHLDYLEATKQCSIRDNEMKAMYNYITNLQKENEKLKDTIKKDNHLLGCNFSKKDKYKQERDIYKQRNEKAIEWCECVVNAKYTADKLPDGKTTDMGYCLDLAEPLLNILDGGDE